MVDALQARKLPSRAVLLSVGALTVPVVRAWLYPGAATDYELLVWLVALIPAFVLAYHRGWRGTAAALAGAMAAMSLAQAGIAIAGGRVESTAVLVTAVIAYTAVALGVGWMAELLHRQRAQLAELAMIDDLTGLPNRRSLRMFLDREFAAAARGRPLTVIAFDIDDFKAYNDKHGHPAGDRAIQALAQALNVTTRRMNLTARVGGEEFISLVRDATPDQALVFVRHARRALDERQPEAGPITISAGVAAYDPAMTSPDDLLEAADQALFRAKRDGKNCTRVFHPRPAGPYPHVPSPPDGPAPDRAPAGSRHRPQRAAGAGRHRAHVPTGSRAS